MPNLTISVVVPCYKGERFIEDCLQMLLSQSYERLEIIVVIDGDIDSSAQIAKKFPVKVIVLEKNHGLSFARNTGKDAASGEYIHFMDVDDQVNPDFYKNIADSLERTHADIAVSGVYCTNKPYKCQMFKEEKLITSLKERMSVTWVSKWGYVWRYVFRKAMLEENNLEFEVGRLIEDLPYSFKALYYAKSIITVPGTQYTYQNVVDSIMNRKEHAWRMKRKEDSQHAKVLVQDFAEEHDLKQYCRGFHFLQIEYIVRKYFINWSHALGLKKKKSI